MPVFSGTAPTTLTASLGNLPHPPLAGMTSSTSTVTPFGENSTGSMVIPVISPLSTPPDEDNQFVDMWELLPEAWHLDSGTEGCCHSCHPRRGLITQFSLWTECYATLVAVLSMHYPHKTPHFMAYLRTITRASRNFEGTAWASYDMAYRRQAANQRSLDWGIIDTALYNEAFTGRAKLIPRCRYCLADSHESRECSFAPDDQEPSGRQAPSSRYRMAQAGVELCQLFNKAAGNSCRYKHCRYAHICAKCRRGSHPAAECETRQAGGRPRSRPPSTKRPTT